MIRGHGDDSFAYDGIRLNFSSNICGAIDHTALYDELVRSVQTVRSYPEPDAASLERLWADTLGLKPENVAVTAGVTEAVYLVAQSTAGSRSAILMPTFSEYADACRMHYHEVVPVCTLADVPHDADLCWLCNPNNPTGKVLDNSELIYRIRSMPDCLFILDHSYAAYTDQSLMTAEYAVGLPNVLMFHSMTKQFAVPGLRLGGVTGAPAVISRLRRYRIPWSVNALAIAAGRYLLLHQEAFRFDLPALLQEKDRVYRLLQEMEDITVTPSDSHILLVRLERGTAADLKQYLAEKHGILIRDAGNFEGLDDRYFRIAVQRPEDNDALINGIRTWRCNV